MNQARIRQSGTVLPRRTSRTDTISTNEYGLPVRNAARFGNIPVWDRFTVSVRQGTHCKAAKYALTGLPDYWRPNQRSGG